MTAAIRPIAVGVVRRGDSILVFRGADPTMESGQYFRPLGGGIEFGESAEEALRREFVEELGVVLGEVKLLGVLENRFELAGVRGHEIVFVFSAEMTGSGRLPATVADTGEVVSWQPLESFRTLSATLVPTGLVELLNAADAE